MAKKRSRLGDHLAVYWADLTSVHPCAGRMKGVTSNHEMEAPALSLAEDVASVATERQRGNVVLVSATAPTALWISTWWKRSLRHLPTESLRFLAVL